MAGGDLPPENKNTGGTLDMERIKELARAIVFALVGYRPQHVTPEMWDREYRDGQWEYLRKMDSIAGLVSILGYCDFLKPASILDAGCGEGLLAEKLKLLPYKSYLGMDVSREAIALATQNLGDARSQFVVADAWLFDTPERFDVIVFNQSLYYLTDPAGILKKYRALLNPGGRIIVSMVDNARTRAVWRLIDPVFGIEDAMTTTQGKGTVVTKVINRAGRLRDRPVPAPSPPTISWRRRCAGIRWGRGRWHAAPAIPSPRTGCRGISHPASP
jgi:SAM-dependent methyltransferase